MDIIKKRIHYTSYDTVFPSHVINAEVDLGVYDSLQDYANYNKFIKAKDLETNQTVLINIDHIIKIV